MPLLVAAMVLCKAAAVGQPPPLQPAQPPFPDAAPESVGLVAADLQAISDQIQKWVDADEVIGAEVHIIKNRKTVLHRSLGLMDRENKTPMVDDTIFCVRSMTKPVVGTAIQILIDEGRIAVDDPAAKYLASFDNEKSRDITIRHLLMHTSGLPLSLIAKMPREYGNLREIADAAGAHGPDFPPGSGFQYSDEGADALGAIVAAVSGKSLDEFVRSRILQPIGMIDTLCAVQADEAKLSRVACAYVGAKGAWEKFWDNTGEGIFPFLFASQSLYCTTMD